MIYNLFISHSWTYPEAYDGLVGLLNNAPGFFYKNYSIPKDNPIHSARSMAELKIAIRSKMAFVSHVVILAGVYSTYSKWINIEVELAKEMGKKIIAVEPWGAERTSKFVKDNADVIVKWQTASIVAAIRG